MTRVIHLEAGTTVQLESKLVAFLREYPDIKVEIIIDYGLTDIVSQCYDAGVRSGEQVAKDMIAVRIRPDMLFAVVGAPSYFAKRLPPRTPQHLIGHNCINLRLPTHGGLYAWEFEKDGRAVKVRVEGQLVFDGTSQLLNAALAGFGLAYVPEGLAERQIAHNRLKRVLEDGALRFRDTTSTTPAGASPRRRSPCWSMRYDTGSIGRKQNSCRIMENDAESETLTRTQRADAVAHGHTVRSASPLHRAVIDCEDDRFALTELDNLCPRLHARP
jgi:DNA-binding transcriptional LysR family regulator